MIKKENDSIRINYRAHEVNISEVIANQDNLFYHIEHQESVYYKTTAAPLKYLDPFLSKICTWLTVGDYNGFEANYLLQRNQLATASDLSDAVLKKAHAKGLINKYCKQNVEQLSYGDNSFDYVMCKEAFHHFPRAYAALYEMIRVSKLATILVTEPIDILSKMASIVLLKNILDRIHPRLINTVWKNRFSWETVGNYVFKVSEREMEKIAMGIGLPCIAFKCYDHFKSHTPVEGMMDVPLNKKLYSKIQLKLWLRSLISRVGIIPHGSICTILFKEQPNEDIIQEMKTLGYSILQLPPNPYLK